MSEFDLTFSHILGKANIVADALLQYCDLDPTNCATVMMGTEPDLLDVIRGAQEYEQTVSFCNLKEQALENKRSIYMHEELVCQQLCAGG